MLHVVISVLFTSFLIPLLGNVQLFFCGRINANNPPKTTILPTKKIGTSQLMSSNIPKAKLLAIAPILPKQVIIQIATAPTCVGNMSTTMLLITKFAVTIINENMQLTIRICKEDSTKYIAKPNIPANNMVVTGIVRRPTRFAKYPDTMLPSKQNALIVNELMKTISSMLEEQSVSVVELIKTFVELSEIFDAGVTAACRSLSWISLQTLTLRLGCKCW